MNAITVHKSPALAQFSGAGQMVKNLRPVLAERGKIKIGRKGDVRTSAKGNQFQPPQKLDHFVVTTMERGSDENFVRDESLHRIIGDKPTEIPIRLLFDDIAMNMQTRYVAFQGRTIWCQGDGETAERGGETRACPCPNLARGYDGKGSGPVCKINGRLQVIIDNAEGVGGVWVFRTTSWNSVQGLISSMALIANVTGGRLAGVPLVLTVRPKQATDPDGRQQTVYVVGIEYRGSIDELRERAYQAALQDAQQGERLRHVHEAAARMIAAPVVSPDEETDVAEEYYPDEVRDDAAEYREPVAPRDLAAELAAQSSDDAHDPETGEVGAPDDPAPFDWKSWLTSMGQDIADCQTIEALTELQSANAGRIAELGLAKPALAEKLNLRFGDRMRAIEGDPE